MDEPSLLPWLQSAIVAEDGDVAPHFLRALHGWGARDVRLARSGAQLLARAREMGATVDLILSDLCLEDGECSGLLPQVRSLAPRTRLVLMTGELSEQDRIDLVYSVRPHAFLTKPFRLDELHRRLASLDPRTLAAGWYYDLARAEGLEDTTRSLRGLARDNAMRDTRGNVSAAARKLGVSRGYMHKLLRKRDEESEPAPPPAPRSRRGE